MNPATLTKVLTDVLNAVTAAFTQTGAPTAPARRFVTHGPPVADDAMLVVSLGGVSPTHPFPLTQIRAIKSSVVPSALVNIECWRKCWPEAHVTSPVKAMPDPAAYTVAAEKAAADASTVFGYITTLATAGTLFPSLPLIRTADDVALGTMVPVGPAGLLVGWRWPLSVKLTDISS